VAALAYGFLLSFREGGAARTLLKVSGVIILAGLAYAAGAPWLLPGMAAFFLAHVFYVALFWQLGEGGGGGLAVKIAQAALVFAGAFYIRWLMPWTGKAMRLPVLLYGGVILMMGAAAIALPAAFWPVTAGALMFIASDAVLAHQLFCRPADAPPNRLASYAVWFLYFFGQTAIMLGVAGMIA